MLFNLPEPLSKEEISEYFSQYRSGKMNAREKLILYNMRLVYYVAYKYKNAGYEIEDLFSIGLIGLMKAIDYFNIEKNIQFSTYASKCINNEILMFFRKNKNKKQEINIHTTTFITKNGSEISLEKFLIDENVNIIQDYEEKEYIEQLNQIINELPETEKKVITLFFGFNGRVYVQREIAEILNVSQSYVSRIIKKIVTKIKKEITNNENPSKNEISISFLTLKHDYQKAILLLQEPRYIKMFSSFTTKQALILLLKLGFVEGKQYNNKVLAEFFKVEEKEIQEIYMNFFKTKQKIYRK